RRAATRALAPAGPAAPARRQASPRARLPRPPRSSESADGRPIPENSCPCATPPLRERRREFYCRTAMTTRFRGFRAFCDGFPSLGLQEAPIRFVPFLELIAIAQP